MKRVWIVIQDWMADVPGINKSNIAVFALAWEWISKGADRYHIEKMAAEYGMTVTDKIWCLAERYKQDWGAKVIFKD